MLRGVCKRLSQLLLGLNDALIATSPICAPTGRASMAKRNRRGSFLFGRVRVHRRKQLADARKEKRYANRENAFPAVEPIRNHLYKWRNVPGKSADMYFNIVRQPDWRVSL